TQRVRDLETEMQQHRQTILSFAEEKGSTSTRLNAVASQAEEFADFMEDWARATVRNLQEDIKNLEILLQNAEKEDEGRVQDKHQRTAEVVERIRHAVEHFDQALITVLRHDFTDSELTSLSRLFNFDLLEQTVGDDGVGLRSKSQLRETLRQV